MLSLTTLKVALQQLSLCAAIGLCLIEVGCFAYRKYSKTEPSETLNRIEKVTQIGFTALVWWYGGFALDFSSLILKIYFYEGVRRILPFDPRLSRNSLIDTVICASLPLLTGFLSGAFQGSSKKSNSSSK